MPRFSEKDMEIAARREAECYLTSTESLDGLAKAKAIECGLKALAISKGRYRYVNDIVVGEAVMKTIDDESGEQYLDKVEWSFLSPSLTTIKRELWWEAEELLEEIDKEAFAKMLISSRYVCSKEERAEQAKKICSEFELTPTDTIVKNLIFWLTPKDEREKLVA